MIYTLGGILLQGVNFLTLPIFTRILSVKDFGIVSIYNTWVGIFSIFICLQCHSSIGNAKVNYSENQFKEYIVNIIYLSTSLFLFWIIVLIILKEEIAKILNLPINIIWIMLIQSFFNAIVILKTYIYIFEESAKKKLLVSFINIFLNILFSIILIKTRYKDQSYLGRIVGGAIPIVILGIYFYLSFLKKKKNKINLEYWRFCLSLSIPIVFHGLSHLILGTSDRILLEKYKGFYETGLYSLIYNFGMIISLIWGALNNAWVPWYYQRMKENNNQIIYKYSKNYLIFFTIICISFISVSPEVIKIMISKEYWSGLNILPLIMMGYFFNFLYSFSVNYEFYTKKTKYIAVATVGAALINIVLNLYFIPKFSGVGAALATLIAYFCIFIFHELIVRGKMKYKILKIRDYFQCIIKLLVFISIYYIYFDNELIRYLFLICYLIVEGIIFLRKGNCSSINLLK